MKLKEIMSSPVHTVSSDRSVRYASEIMDQLEIGSLVVKDHDAIVGIITSRDIRKAHPNRIVADAMTPHPVSVSSDSFAWEALELMMRLRIERVIVHDQAGAVGLITRDSIQIHMSELKDPLTELYRPGYIQSIGTEMLCKKEPFHLIFIDMDNFGEINKKYGHPVGDDIIQGFAGHLRSLASSQDYLCRYAGDEFVVISVRTENQIAELVEALNEPLTIADIPVSAAIGVISESNEPGFFSLSFREMISRASLASTYSKKHYAVMS